MMHGYFFTERMRVVLAMAREEAARLHHEYVGTEHMLLALVQDGEGVASAVLGSLDVDREAIRRQVEKVVQPGKSAVVPRPDLPYTSRAKVVLEQAMNSARELEHSYVGTEHLLLGILREGKGIAGQVLAAAGVTVDAARSEVVRILASGAAPPLLQPVSGAESPAVEKRPVERVEVILHYADGRRFEGSFASVREAISYLRTGTRPNGD